MGRLFRVFTRCAWTAATGWPGLINIADGAGYENDLALKTALTNNGLDMYQYSSVVFGVQRYQVSLLAGVLQLAVGVCIATGRFEKRALLLLMAWNAWLMFVVYCLANELGPAELQKHAGFKPNPMTKEMWMHSVGVEGVENPSMGKHVFFILIAAWRYRGLSKLTAAAEAQEAKAK